MNSTDKISHPETYRLGTRDAPYVSEEDQERLGLEVTFLLDTTQAEERSEHRSEEDEPTTDLKTEREVAHAAEILEDLELSQTPKLGEYMSQTQTYDAQIAYTGIAPQTAGGRAGPPTLGTSGSSHSTSGAAGGSSSTPQTASRTAGSGSTSGTAPGGPSNPGGSVPALTGANLPAGGSSGGPPAGGGSGGPLGGGGGGGLPGGGGPPAVQQAGQAGTVQVGPLPVANRSLRGHPPEIFDGQRKNTQKFIKEFTLWKMCNLRNEAMMNPFQ